MPYGQSAFGAYERGGRHRTARLHASHAADVKAFSPRIRWSALNDGARRASRRHTSYMMPAIL